MTVTDVKQNNAYYVSLYDTLPPDELSVSCRGDKIHINKRFLVDNKVNLNDLEMLKTHLFLRIAIEQEMTHIKDTFQLKELFLDWELNEFEIQHFFGVAKNRDYHKFWLVPNCSCPIIDNQERWGTSSCIYEKDCPIHGFVETFTDVVEKKSYFQLFKEFLSECF